MNVIFSACPWIHISLLHKVMLSETFPITKTDGFVRIRDLQVVLQRILRKMGSHTVGCQGAQCDGVLEASICQVVKA